MTESVPVGDRVSFGEIWRRSPVAWKIAAVVAVGGWFLHVGGYSQTTENGVRTSCSGFDAGPFIAGGIVLLATLVGLKRIKDAHPARRPSAQTTRIVVVILLAAAAALLLRGAIDPDGGYC